MLLKEKLPLCLLSESTWSHKTPKNLTVLKVGLSLQSKFMVSDRSFTLKRSHEKAPIKSLFVNSIKVYYDQTKVSQNMVESMTIFAGNVLSFNNIYKTPTEL